MGRDETLVRTGFCVGLVGEHDLGRTVPSRHDVLGHEAGHVLGLFREAPRQSKITDLRV